MAIHRTVITRNMLETTFMYKDCYKDRKELERRNAVEAASATLWHGRWIDVCWGSYKYALDDPETYTVELWEDMYEQLAKEQEHEDTT